MLEGQVPSKTLSLHSAEEIREGGWGKPKSGSLSENWHQGPKGINTFTPHKAPTQPTYGYEGVRKCEPFCSTLFTFLQLVRCT